jgi:hypothetical protein
MSDRQVWKTPLWDDVTDVEIGPVVHVGVDPKIPSTPVVVWHESAPATRRRLHIVGTGHPVPDGTVHRGTAVRPDGLVFHVYEESHTQASGHDVPESAHG